MSVEDFLNSFLTRPWPRIRDSRYVTTTSSSGLPTHMELARAEVLRESVRSLEPETIFRDIIFDAESGFQPKQEGPLAICPRCGGVHALVRFMGTNSMTCGNPEDGEFDFALSDSLAGEAIANYIKKLESKNKKGYTSEKGGQK